MEWRGKGLSPVYMKAVSQCGEERVLVQCAWGQYLNVERKGSYSSVYEGSISMWRGKGLSPVCMKAVSQCGEERVLVQCV